MTPGASLLSFLPALCILGKLGRLGEVKNTGSLGSGKAIPKHKQWGGSCLSHPWPCRGCPKAQDKPVGHKVSIRDGSVPSTGTCWRWLWLQDMPKVTPKVSSCQTKAPGQPHHIPATREGWLQGTEDIPSAAQGVKSHAAPAPACHPHCACHRGQAQGRGGCPAQPWFCLAALSQPYPSCGSQTHTQPWANPLLPGQQLLPLGSWKKTVPSPISMCPPSSVETGKVFLGFQTHCEH